MQHSSINPRIAALSPYKPGKPVDEVARELGINDIVKLASNENPRGPGEKVQQAIAEAATELSRYPDGGGFALKSQLAEKIGVEPNQLTLGNGSNDVLDRAGCRGHNSRAQLCGLPAGGNLLWWRLSNGACERVWGRSHRNAGSDY